MHGDDREVLGPEHAKAFREVPREYDAGRPDYPDDAVSWLVGDAATVVELGAGTGKMTASLVEHSRVIATEPLPEMIGVLKRNVPAAWPLMATAERIPLRAGVADVVISAQAFHWFDAPVALSSAARVLRPGGRVALVWNMRDGTVPWVAQLSDIIGRSEQLHQGWDAAFATSRFGPLEHVVFRHSQTLDLERLCALVSSRSYLVVAAEDQRRRVLAEVRSMAKSHPDLAGRETFELPYFVDCFRATVTA